VRCGLTTLTNLKLSVFKSKYNIKLIKKISTLHLIYDKTLLKVKIILLDSSPRAHTPSKKAGGLAQVVKYLPGQREAKFKRKYHQKKKKKKKNLLSLYSSLLEKKKFPLEIFDQQVY
jgi:hypothetical protein